MRRWSGPRCSARSRSTANADALAGADLAQRLRAFGLGSARAAVLVFGFALCAASGCASSRRGGSARRVLAVLGVATALVLGATAQLDLRGGARDRRRGGGRACSRRGAAGAATTAPSEAERMFAVLAASLALGIAARGGAARGRTSCVAAGRRA